MKRLPTFKGNVLAAGAVFAAVLIQLLTAAGAASAAEIIASYYVPGNRSGLAWDGRLLWMGGMGQQGDWLVAFDPAREAIVDSIRAPSPNCFGMTWFEGRLAYLSAQSDSTYFIHREGALTVIENPYGNMSGLAADGANLWSSSFHNPNGTLVNMDGQGRVLASMPYLGRLCRDMTLHRGILFAADRQTHEVREIDPNNGHQIANLEYPGSNPSGLASDGDYLWLLDDGNKPGFNHILKIFVREDGGIRFSSLAHNYGSVVIDDEASWRVWIYNDALRTAHLRTFDDRGGNRDIFPAILAFFPQEILPGDSVSLEILFKPAWVDSAHIEYGIAYDIDRETYWINLRGKGVNPGRDIAILNRTIDFQYVRQGFYDLSSNLQYLNLENRGGEPLTIRELRFSNQAYHFSGFELPHTFTEPGLYRIPIFLRPNGQGNQQAFLVVVSDDQDTPEITVTLRGYGIQGDSPGGARLWEITPSFALEDDPGIRAMTTIQDISGDGLNDVLIATNDYKIISLHAAGTIYTTPIWTYHTSSNPWRDGGVVSPDGLSNGDDWNNDGYQDVVAGLGDLALSVIALSGKDGQRLWTFDTHSHQDGGGAAIFVKALEDINDDNYQDVIAAFRAESESYATNALTGLDGSNGRLIWEFEMQSPPLFVRMTSDLTGDGVSDVFVLDENRQLMLIDGRRGNQIWEAQVAGDIREVVAMRGDVNGDGSGDVSVVTNGHGIWMFNGSNGMELWQRPSGTPNVNIRNLTAAVGLNDVNGNGSPDLVVGEASRSVWCIDGRTGQMAWRRDYIAGSEVTSLSYIPDINGDRRDEVVVGTYGGIVCVVSGDGESGLWIANTPNVGIARVLGISDIDGNGYWDVLGLNSEGQMTCYAGTWIGNILDTSDFASDDQGLFPYSLVLNPAYPNPFNSSVRIPFQLGQPGEVVFRVFDLGGREVHRMNSGSLTTGSHNLYWDAGTAASGSYLLQLQAGSNSSSRLVQLVR